jgi:dTDP-4-dehydrorhamnose reductase
MRVLVIGKAGQLARCLADERPRDVDAVFLGRDQLDLASPGAAPSVLDEARPDVAAILLLSLPRNSALLGATN